MKILPQGCSIDFNPGLHFLACSAALLEFPVIKSGEHTRQMKKQKTSNSIRVKIAEKRQKRALRSKAKKQHRMSTGFKELEEKSAS